MPKNNKPIHLIDRKALKDSFEKCHICNTGIVATDINFIKFSKLLDHAHKIYKKIRNENLSDYATPLDILDIISNTIEAHIGINSIEINSPKLLSDINLNYKECIQKIETTILELHLSPFTISIPWFSTPPPERAISILPNVVVSSDSLINY